MTQQSSSPALWHDPDRLTAAARLIAPDARLVERLHGLLGLAAQLCEAPAVAIHLITEHQVTLAALNLPDGPVALEHSPSARALESAAALVEFAADDATALSLSDGTPARHYAAVILRDGQHRPLGTLCVLNAAVQPLPAQQARQLQTLADQVMALFELRLQREDEAGVLRDGQRQVEIAHEQSEAYVRLLLDSASEAFYSIDTEGRVTLCNEAFLRLLGFASRDAVLGRQLHDVIHHSHPDGRPYDVRDCPIHRSARSGESAHVERELFFRQDGSALPVEYRVVPVYRDGVLQGALCTFADVSERTRREALQALLLDISDRLQASSEHIDLRCVLDARLGRLTNSDGIALGHLDGDDALVLTEQWHAPNAGDRLGRHPLGGLDLAPRLAAGSIVSLKADGDPATATLGASLGSQALLLAPLSLPEQAPGTLFLLFTSNQPRDWPSGDIALVRELTERIRAAGERIATLHALREAEQRISLANEIASIGVWEYNETRRSLHWDNQLKALANMQPDDPTPSAVDVLQRVHPEDRGELLNALRRALQGLDGGEFHVDYRILDPRSDDYIWLTNRGRRVLDANGEVRILGTSREVTAERNAAEHMRQMNALLEEQINERRLVERRQAALIELGDLLREEHDSPTIAEAAVRVIGSTLRIDRVLLTNLDPGGLSGTIERYWSDGLSAIGNERVYFADFGDLHYDLLNDELVVIDDVLNDARTAPRAALFAERRIASLVCVPLFEQGQLAAALMLLEEAPRHWQDDEIAFIREVADRAWTADERMRAERALRESEEQFRTLADNMSQFAWMADPSGRIYWYNKRWYDYTGTTFEAMRALGWATVHHPEHRERVTGSLKRAFAIGSIWEETFPLRGKDGRYRWFLSRALPIRDDYGQVTHWFGTSTDVTAQVAAEEALRELNDSLERRVIERTRELAQINNRLHIEMAERERAEEALRHAQKMEAIGQLTGGLAHDFNNMLTGVLGALDLIQRRVESGRFGELGRYLDAAMTSANRAAALTHRLLAFARRQSLDPRPVDVNQLVASMEDMLRRTIGEHIRLDSALQEPLWQAYTDAHQLENALLNLVINSRDAMPDGGHLNIATRNVQVQPGEPDSPEAGDYVLLSVADTGSGMSAEVIAKAFDPFFTTKPIGQGTGLGLSMVYGFAKQTGGHVHIDSTPGEGTLISLYLPRNHIEHTADAQRRALAQPPEADGETVLVIEDEVAVRMLVIEVLRELGYQVLEASDAPSAMPFIESDRRIDLVVSDVGLPGLNGRQLADLARQHRPTLKVLFITGYVPSAEQRKDFLAPGMDMLAKPFNIDELASRIRQLIES
ncbi:PAS domain-containing protein [Stutzerimonas stutzeri]|nr:PAS domain-containing protein [Stutzerimonas stutzeri]